MWPVRTHANREVKCVLQGDSPGGKQLMDWDGSSIDCITEHGGFQSVCLDVWVLQTALYQTRQEHGRSSTSGPVYKYSVAFGNSVGIRVCVVAYSILCVH